MCVEIALWDRFGWGPEQTRKLTLRELRELFAILEQQQVSKNYKEQMGPGTQGRAAALLESEKQKAAQMTQAKMRTQEQMGQPLNKV